MAHLRRMGQLVSPTPIRPHSPAGSPSRERGDTPRQTKAAFLGCDSQDGDDEATGEMCEELMQIFACSPRCAPPGPTDCNTGGHATVQPPSRNQNPLVKDQRFSTGSSHNESHALASSLSAALCSEQQPLGKSPPQSHPKK